MKRLIVTAFLLASVFAALGVTSVYAQNPGGGAPTSGPGGGAPTSIKFGIDNPFKKEVGDSLFTLLQNILDKIVLPLGAVLCVLAFIYAGFRYVMAQGNPTAIADANRMLLYAAIGTAVLLGAWVLARAICNTIHLLGGPACTI